MSLRTKVLTRSQLPQKRTKHNEDHDEETEGRLEPKVHKAHHHNDLEEEHNIEDTEEHSKEKSGEGTCIQENSETSMDNSAHKPALEMHETTTQSRIGGENYSNIRDNLLSPDSETRLKALRHLRQLTCSTVTQEEAFTDDIRALLPIIVKCVTEEEKQELQLEAVWTITNITSGTLKDTNAVIDAGAVPIIMPLLFSPELEIQDQALFAIGNIISDDARSRDYVISVGAMKSVLQLAQGASSLRILRITSWILQNFTRTKEPPLELNVVQEILPVLCELLYNRDDEVLSEAVAAFTWLTGAGNERVQLVINCPNVVCRLVKCMSHTSKGIQKLSLQAVTNIMRGTEEQLTTVRQCLGESEYNKLLEKIKTHSKSC